MKNKLLQIAERFVPSFIADLHQLLLLAAVAGLAAFLFSGDIVPNWTLAVTVVLFAAGVFISQWEK